MQRLDSQLALRALRAVGTELASSVPARPARVVIAGGVAGLLGGWLSGARTTGDCDVISARPEEGWPAIESAAHVVALQLGLPSTWLNRDCSSFAWCLPLGWADRAEPVGQFGPLEVARLSRFDLIASKVMGAPKRPQDLEDLRALSPTPDELDRIVRHLDRLNAEHLGGGGGDRFDEQRLIVGVFRRAVP